jgi:hypothetical protein
VVPEKGMKVSATKVVEVPETVIHPGEDIDWNNATTATGGSASVDRACQTYSVPDSRSAGAGSEQTPENWNRTALDGLFGTGVHGSVLRDAFAAQGVADLINLAFLVEVE